MVWKKATAAAMALALSPTGVAKAEAVCAIDTYGGTGTARCVGSIGQWTVDPSPVPAQVGRGWLTFRPRRLVSFDPDPAMTFAGRWSGVGPLVSGSGVIEGRTVPFLGDVRMAANGIQLELVLGAPSSRRGRPRSRACKERAAAPGSEKRAPPCSCLPGISRRSAPAGCPS